MGEGSYFGGSSIIHTGRSTEGYNASRTKKSHKAASKAKKKRIRQELKGQLRIQKKKFYIRKFMADIVEAYLKNGRLPKPPEALKTLAPEDYQNIRESGPIAWFKNQPKHDEFFREAAKDLLSCTSSRLSTKVTKKEQKKPTQVNKKKAENTSSCKTTRRKKLKTDMSNLTVINTNGALEGLPEVSLKNRKQTTGNIVLSRKQKKKAVRELHKKSGYYDRKIIMVQGGSPGTGKK